MEKELHQPVDMCLKNGTLNEAAVGWSRFPVHNANLKGWGRRKRFDYWCVVSPEMILAFSISDTDYKAATSLFFFDRKTQTETTASSMDWFRSNPSSRAPWGSQQIRSGDKDVDISITFGDQIIALNVATANVNAEVQVSVPDDHQSMGVLVPWNSRRFQYTRKDNCLTASGRVRANGVTYRLDETTTTATMDHGRGKWPYDTLWNWASGSGTTDGEVIGLQFGAKWTAGTPSTENALRLGGQIEKISEELEWMYDTDDWMAPWTIKGERVDLTFTPEYHRHSEFDKKIVSSREEQVFGHFSGTVGSLAGREYRVENIFGWAEEVHRRW